MARVERIRSQLRSNGLFNKAHKIEGTIYHKQPIQDCLDAWRSHATLFRQAGNNFNAIISGIEKLLSQINLNEIIIPYTTRIWMAQVKK